MDLLSTDRPTVLVSLPENDPELAEAAVAAGADGVKVHLNVSHRASGNAFGDVDAEAASIEKIADIGVPVGAVPGQDLATIERTLPRLDDLPLSFADAYAHHLPANANDRTDLPIWVAPSDDYGREEIVGLRALPAAAVELSVVPKDRYGSRVSARDLATYADIASRIDRPVVLPSQLELTPEDGATLLDHGITNFLLGVIVTGDDPAGLEQAVGEFVDELSG